MKSLLNVSAVGLSLLMLSACGKTLVGNGTNLPLVTPIVKEATPTGLKGSVTASILNFLYSKSYAIPANLSVDELKSRFFSTGPTAILNNILPSVDALIMQVNTQSIAVNSACLYQDPVSYTVHPFGQSVTMYAQCYLKNQASYSDDPGLVQFGVKDGVTYIYSASGAEWQAFIVTPIAGADGQYTVKGYIGLGYSNTSGCSSTWDGCSYGGMEIAANSSAKTFELSVAGMGFGYCGAQLVSDGTNIFAKGSVDMGTSCLPVASACVSASDTSSTATCTADQQVFSLDSLGRSSVASTATLVVGNWGASAYPASGANVSFDGSSGDDIHFGPTTPTVSVGNIELPKE